MSDVLGLNSPVDRKPAEMLGCSLIYEDLEDFDDSVPDADPEGIEDEDDGD